MIINLNLSVMNAYLVIFANETSEWLATFEKVKHFMSELEKNCIINNVKVSKFENSKLTKTLTYNYNGEQWQKA